MDLDPKCKHTRIVVTDATPYLGLPYCGACQGDFPPGYKFKPWQYCTHCGSVGTYDLAVRGERACLECSATYLATVPMRRGKKPDAYAEGAPEGGAEMDEV